MNNNPSRKNVIDIIRGVACLIVFNSHLTGNLTAHSLWGYGADDIYVWAALPFTRLWFMGSSSLTVFYVISGYVQSHSAFTQAYQHNNIDGALRSLSSSIIRRGIRLYLPTFISVYIVALSSYIGLFNASRSNFGKDNEVYYLYEQPPPRFDGLGAQLLDATKLCAWLIPVGTWPSNNLTMHVPYNPHVWTIPLEFHTSMVLYLIVMCTCRMTFRYMLATHTLLMAYACHSDRWEILCFVAGATVCANDVVSSSLDDKVVKRKKAIGQLKADESSAHKYSSAWVSVLGVLAGLFCLSVPGREPLVDPFYGPLVTLFPSNNYDSGVYIRAPGAVLLLWSSLRWSRAQHGVWYGGDILSYLGRISFSIYLVHGPIIRCLFHALIPTIYAYTGDGTYDGQNEVGTVIAWLVGVMVCFPLTIVAAQLFHRTVELPSVRFARWFEGRAFRDFKARSD